MRGRPKPPSELGPAQLDARERALDALARSRRDGISLTRSARLTRTTPRTVLRYAGAGYERAGRTWQPRDFDRLPRSMRVLTDRGPVDVTTRDSRTATHLAEHANAVQRYLDTGDERALRALRRKDLQIGGQRFSLPTDPVILGRLADGGELHYELYRL